MAVPMGAYPFSRRYEHTPGPATGLPRLAESRDHRSGTVPVSHRLRDRWGEVSDYRAERSTAPSGGRLRGAAGPPRAALPRGGQAVRGCDVAEKIETCASSGSITPMIF